MLCPGFEEEFLSDVLHDAPKCAQEKEVKEENNRVSNLQVLSKKSDSLLLLCYTRTILPDMVMARQIFSRNK